jgi:iron complex outermembrane receptor protein
LIGDITSNKKGEFMLDYSMGRDRAVAALVAVSTLMIVCQARALSAGSPSGADQSQDSSLQEIVVTAERRSSKLQETPLALTPISGSDLERRNIQTLLDLASSLPTLNMGETEGVAHPSIRGIGSSDIIFGSDPRVAFYLDDVYIARPQDQLGVLYDVDQIEVLDGPQGTLYGRNATGGALLVSSSKPTSTPSGYINLTYGNYNEFASEGALSGPLGDTLSARIAFQTTDHSGYGENLLTGHDIDNAHKQSVRLSLLWKPASDFSFLLQTDYHREKDNDYANHYGGLGNLGSPPLQPTGVRLGGFLPPVDSRNIANAVDPFNDRAIWGASGTATWNLGSVTLKSITAYRHTDVSLTTEIDPSSLSLAPLDEQVQSARQVSEELQAIAEMGRNHLIVGLSYFDEYLSGQTPVGLNLELFGGPNFLSEGVDQAGNISTKSAALYLRDSYDFTDRLTAILGGRYTYEKKTVLNEFGEDLTEPYSSSNPIANIPPFPYSAEKAYNAFTPSATLDYKFTPHIFGYLTVTQGFKSGGFNVGVDQPAFQPEKIWDYEIGLKTTTLDNRLQANFSSFYYDYSNLQVSVVDGTQVLIQNAAKAALYGAEAQFTALPWQTLQLELGLSALHSEYKDYMETDPANPQLGLQNLAGNQLTQAPKFKVTSAAQYTWPIPSGHLTIRGEYSWVDTIYFTPFDTPNDWSPAHSLSNLFLNYDSNTNWSAKAYVRNLANKTIVGDAYTATSLLGDPVNVSLEPPRTFGITVGYKF